MARYLLLVESVSVNAQDHAGWTSLHEACSSCNLRIAELLLQCGADVNLSATDGTRYMVGGNPYSLLFECYKG